MGVVKYCDKCHKKISLREMPNGAWLPFEYDSDILHECIYDDKTATVSNTTSKVTKYDLVFGAIKENKDIVFKYQGKNDVTHIQRHITPKAIKNGQVSGFCHLRNANRIFNLDDMHYIEIVENGVDVGELLKIRKENQKGIKYELVYKNGVRTFSFYFHRDVDINYSYRIGADFKKKLLKSYVYIVDLNDLEDEKQDKGNLQNYTIIKSDSSSSVPLDRLITEEDVRQYRSEIWAKEFSRRKYSNSNSSENKFVGWLVAGVIIIIIVFLSNI